MTVEAAVSDNGRAGVTFIDIGGAYPDNDFAAVIFGVRPRQVPERRRFERQDRGDQWRGGVYQAQIILEDTDQLKPPQRARRTQIVRYPPSAITIDPVT